MSGRDRALNKRVERCSGDSRSPSPQAAGRGRGSRGTRPDVPESMQLSEDALTGRRSRSRSRSQSPKGDVIYIGLGNLQSGTLQWAFYKEHFTHFGQFARGSLQGAIEFTFAQWMHFS